MKRVFRTWKYVSQAGLDSRNDLSNLLYLAKRILDKESWIYVCDGLTLEEMKLLGYCTDDLWMVEE